MNNKSDWSKVNVSLVHEKTIERELFGSYATWLMAGIYAVKDIYVMQIQIFMPVKASFVGNEIQQSSLVIKMMFS